MSKAPVITTEFKKNIRKWEKLAESIDLKKEEMDEEKDKRDALTPVIVDFLCQANLASEEIKVNNNILKCSTKKTTTPLNRKFIEACLTEYTQNNKEAKEVCNIIFDSLTKLNICLSYYYKDEEKVKEIMDHIQNKRVTVETMTLKRKKNKETALATDDGSETS